MFRADWPLLLTLAGVFVFFPAFALFLFAPMPEGQAQVSDQMLQQIIAYYKANMIWFVLVNAISAFGQAAILALLLDRARPTVGEALTHAGTLFPSYFIAQFLTNFATGAAVILVVPAIYLLGRFATVGPLLVAERVTNPIRAIGAGWRETHQRGWRVAGLILLVAIVAWIAMTAATSALTILLALVVPESMRPLTGGLGSALDSTALTLIMVVLSAAIHRQLAGGRRIGDVFS